MKWDIFISHASEDKDNFVRPLAEKLKKYGFKIWYDELNIKVGDSLKESIENGIKNSKYAIVILSKIFFEKSWTKLELNSLFSKEIIYNEKVIIPIWLDINQKELFEMSPLLADKLAITHNSNNGNIDFVIEKLHKIILKSKYSTEEITFHLENLKKEKNKYRLQILSDEIKYRISQLINSENEKFQKLINNQGEWNENYSTKVNNVISDFYKLPIGISFHIDRITHQYELNYYKKQLDYWVRGKLNKNECYEIFNTFFIMIDANAYKYIFFGFEDYLVPNLPDEEYYQKMINEIGTRNYSK